MVHIAIVEDEDIYRSQLIKNLERFQEETGNKMKITEFPDGEDILDGYKSCYDIIFMDIQMRFMDGMTAAEKIRELDSDVIIIFITNMTQYAIQGYQVNALDYIVKPIEYFALKVKLNKAIEKLDEKEKYFIRIPINDGIRRMDIDSIYYIESQGHELTYKTKAGELKSRGVLKKIENTLEAYGFFCCAKGILINMQYVESVNENTCVINGEVIPISRRKKKVFMEKLLHYVDEVV